MAKKKMDKFTRKWIIENALEEIPNYEPGELTVRGLHYRLVSRGMTNTVLHYNRVIKAMIHARWDGRVSFDTFSDHDRETLGETRYEETILEDEQAEAEDQIQRWMSQYRKNPWENQSDFIEIWIEKKALLGIFKPICKKYNVALAACKGYPSLTFLNDAAARFDGAERSHHTKILYFGDYDPSGEDIPRSIKDNLARMGVEVEVDRRLLLEDQVVEWGLPPAPVKVKDSRSATWDGLGQVELDAVEPSVLREHIVDAILENRDPDLYDELMNQQQSEETAYRKNLKAFVRSL